MHQLTHTCLVEVARDFFFFLFGAQVERNRFAMRSVGLSCVSGLRWFNWRKSIAEPLGSAWSTVRKRGLGW